MPNTVIALKKSATPAAIPLAGNLANGEIAINFADGKLFYKNTAGQIAEISGAGNEVNSFGTVNANNTLIVSDMSGDILTLSTGNNISIVGSAVNDTITIGLKDDVTVPGLLSITAASGDEGGEIRLANAITNSLLAGPVNIDIFRNQLRFFVSGGDARGAFINLASTSAGVGTDLLASASDSTARATASAAFDKANAALPNVSGVSFNGNLTVTQNLTSDRVITLNNGNGENFKVGDDTWIGDTNLANALRIKGQQNASIGYVMFGPNDGKLLGRAGTDNLTYDGNTIWHAGNDGASSGLDADLLDGQHGSYYAIATDTAAAFAKANAANVLAFNTGVGANAFTSATIAGANTAVGAGANTYLLATLSGANTAVGTGANTYLLATIAGANTAVGTGANTYLLATIAGANTEVGGGANTFTSATISGANTAVGTGANTYLLATIAGANTAVGAGANAFATAAAAGANAYMIVVQNGANTAVGTGANTYLLATLSGANTAVGTGANAFTSATISGANTAVGAGANNYSNATFIKLTAAEQTLTGNLNIVGNFTLSGNTVFIDATRLQIDDPLIYLAGNNYTSDIVDIGFIGNYVNATGANVHTGLYREHTDKMYYLFNGYDKEPENNHIGALSNNMTLAVLNADIRTSNLSLGGVNALITITSAFDKANAANLLAFNTGVGANAFAAATIAGANTAVGTGANTVAVAAFAKANSALANTSGVSFNGNLNFPTGNVGIGKSSSTSTLDILGIQTNSSGTSASQPTGTLRLSYNGGSGIGEYGGSVVFSQKWWSSSSDIIATGQITGVKTTGDGNFGGGLAFWTGGNGENNLSERMRIDSSGNIGIGTTPNYRLHVSKTSTLSSGSDSTAYIYARPEQTSTASMAALTIDSSLGSLGSGGFKHISVKQVGAGFPVQTEVFNIGTDGTGYFAGSVGIGTTSPVVKLVVSNAGAQGFEFNPNSSGLAQIETYNRSTSAYYGFRINADDIRLHTGASATERMRIASDGSVGIGTDSPAFTSGSGLEIQRSGIATLRLDSGTYATELRALTDGTQLNQLSPGYITLGTNNTERMRIDSSGNVGIGTASPSYTLQVNGSFAATTKSFVIDHPTKSGMKLRYGSLEGPENGVYVRGRVHGPYIYLPDYWKGLVDEDSITVSLTPIAKTEMPSVLSYNNEKIVLHSDSPIDCFYHVFGERKDVDKLIVEY